MIYHLQEFCKDYKEKEHKNILAHCYVFLMQNIFWVKGSRYKIDLDTCTTSMAQKLLKYCANFQLPDKGINNEWAKCGPGQQK